jgi:hypothetical protein
MGELGLHELEDVLLERQRVINSMHARQLRVMATIASRFGGEYQSEQVGLWLKWSSNWAADRVSLAAKAVDRLPASLAALERGEIDLYPGCSMPAHRADTDHTQAFPDGPTAPENSE